MNCAAPGPPWCRWRDSPESRCPPRPRAYTFRHAGPLRGGRRRLHEVRAPAGVVRRADPLRLGVNWYLTADECHNADGKHTVSRSRTRHHRSLENCDPELLCRLSEVVSGHRSVAAIEAARGVRAGSRTFPELLGVAMGDTGGASGTAGLLPGWPGLTWCSSTRTTACGPAGGPKPNKFAFTDELADYTSRGQSLVVYHHADRAQVGVLAQDPRRLGELAAATRTCPWAR